MKNDSTLCYGTGTLEGIHRGMLMVDPCDGNALASGPRRPHGRAESSTGPRRAQGHRKVGAEGVPFPRARGAVLRCYLAMRGCAQVGMTVRRARPRAGAPITPRTAVFPRARLPVGAGLEGRQKPRRRRALQRWRAARRWVAAVSAGERLAS